MSEATGPLYLYCIPRTDMASMTAGRMAAQVSHASTKFLHDSLSADKETKKLVDTWMKEADGFGTTIILAPKTVKDQVNELNSLVDIVNNLPHTMAGLVIDPEYFLVDGDFVHMLPDVLTCAYFFGYKNILSEVLSEYRLY